MSSLPTMVVVEEPKSSPRRPASTLSDRRLLDPKQNLQIIKRSLSASGRTSPSPILSGPYLTGSPASSPVRRPQVPLVPTGKEATINQGYSEKRRENDKNDKKEPKEDDKSVQNGHKNNENHNKEHQNHTKSSGDNKKHGEKSHNGHSTSKEDKEERPSTVMKSKITHELKEPIRKKSLGGIEEISLADVTNNNEKRPRTKDLQFKKAFRRDSDVEITVNLADQLRQARLVHKSAKRRMSEQTSSAASTSSSAATSSPTTRGTASSGTTSASGNRAVRRRTSTGSARPQSVAQRVIQERQNRVQKMESSSTLSPNEPVERARSTSPLHVALRRSASQHSLPKAAVAEQLKRHVHFGQYNNRMENNGNVLKPILKKSVSMEIAKRHRVVRADIH